MNIDGQYLIRPAYYHESALNEICIARRDTMLWEGREGILHENL